MVKKKFIDQGKGTTYRLVHRSQQDRAVEGDESASAFVLVPASTVNEREKKHRMKQRQAIKGEPVHTRYHDHINEFGLPDDGTSYDYSKHMKTIGGGTFITKDGKLRLTETHDQETRDRNRAILPPDALPTEGGEVARNFNAITISERVMERDMEEIIFGEVDDFEELDDDFVLQAVGDTNEISNEFDFDAHIAKLIAASEREVGLHPKSILDIEEYEIDSVSLNDSAEKNDSKLAEQFLADEFEATLAGYGSDTWGEGEEEGSEERGNEDEMDRIMEKCVDEFMQDEADLNWFEGLGRKLGDEPRVWQGSKATDRSSKIDIDVDKLEENDTDELNACMSNVRLGSLRGLGAHPKVPYSRRLVALNEENDDDWCPIDETFEYFKPQPEEKWDCETVLSTYSTLDNHPKVLSIRSAKNCQNRGKSQFEVLPIDDFAPIVLSNKTGIPLGILDQKKTPKKELKKYNCENLGKVRSREETPEERRMRKSKVKEDRKNKREQKVAVQAMYREGGKAASKVMSNPETANRRSVFGYS